MGVLALPFGPQQSVEHLLLHQVLSLDAEDVLNPHPRDAQCKLSQDNGSHQGNAPVDGPGDDTRSHVDGALHGPNHQQAARHAQHTYRGVEQSLSAVAAQHSPQPPHDIAYRVLALGVMQFLYQLHFFTFYFLLLTFHFISRQLPTSFSRAAS